MSYLRCGLRTAHTTSSSSRFFIQPPSSRRSLLPYKRIAGLQLRHASSTTGTSTSPSTATATPTTAVARKGTTSVIANNDLVNPPTSTLPAPLVIEKTDPNANLFNKLYQQGRGYLTFYKTGLKNVWHNYKASRIIQSRISSAGSRSPLHTLPSTILSRGDFILLHRSRLDIRRLPAFAAILLICGEYTPFLVPFITSIVPLTCRIPSQMTRDRRKLEERRQRSFRELIVEPPPPPPPPTGTPSRLYSGGDQLEQGAKNGEKKGQQKNEEEVFNRLNREQLLHISRSLGLHSRWWFDESLPRLSPPSSLLKRRVKKAKKFIETDDKLIDRDGGVEKLDIEEVKMAMVDRGLDVLGRQDGELRNRLRDWVWLRERKGWRVETMFLTRYDS